MTKTKVVVGLSGGVDSSVSAKLLVDQGYDVTGVFMKNWEGGDELCTATEDAMDAMRVAEKIGIPFETVNFSKAYWDHVFEYFLAENRAGRTPNPDILCNKFIKFDAFLKYAESIGAEYLATGHYAAVKKVHSDKREEIKDNKTLKSLLDSFEFQLCIPKDTAKDQTYFLHQLNQYQLSKTMFPLADYTKAEVRQLALDWGLVTAEKKDSTGICFIGERNYQQFLSQYLSKQPGDIQDFVTKKKVGTHQGLSFYTLGQSKGVGIGGQRDFPEGKWFVLAKNKADNILYVTQDESLLMSDELTTTSMHWIAGEPPTDEFECTGKVRYRDVGTPCRVRVMEESIQVKFLDPVRAITPGQSVVLYDGDACLGGGEIE